MFVLHFWFLCYGITNDLKCALNSLSAAIRLRDAPSLLICRRDQKIFSGSVIVWPVSRNRSAGLKIAPGGFQAVMMLPLETPFRTIVAGGRRYIRRRLCVKSPPSEMMLKGYLKLGLIWAVFRKCLVQFDAMQSLWHFSKAKSFFHVLRRLLLVCPFLMYLMQVLFQFLL